jgi:hypothetical protein
MKGRAKSSVWPLRPDDLPPEWAVERAPQLDGVENNAFFRLLTLDRGRRDGFALIAPLALVAAFSLSFISPAMGFLWPLLLFGLSIRMALAAIRPPKWRGLMLRPHPLMVELARAGFGSEDAALALWAFASSRRALHRAEIVRLFALAMLGLMLWPISLEVHRYNFDPWAGLYVLAPFLVAFAASICVARLGRPHFGLGALSRQARMLADRLSVRIVDYAAPDSSADGGDDSMMMVMLVACGAPVLLVLTLIATEVLPRAMRAAGFDPFDGEAYAVYCSFGAAVGAIAGYGLAWVARRDAPYKLALLTESLRRLFNGLRNREDREGDIKARR